MGMLADTTNILAPTATIIPEAVVFFILLALAAKYIVPPINRALEARRAQIAESLEVIEQAKTMESETRAEAQAILDQARQEARATTEQASRLAEELRDEVLAKARAEQERILTRAQGEITRATQRATEEVRASLADLVIAASERVVAHELDAARQRGLVDEAIAAVEASTEPSVGATQT